MTGRHNLDFRFRQGLLRQRVMAIKQHRPGWRMDPLLKRDVLLATLRSWPSLAIVAIILAGAIWLLAVFGLSGGFTLSIIMGGVLLGLMGEIGLAWFNLNDETQLNQALARRLQPTIAFDLATIRDKRLRARLHKALDCWQQIDEAVSKASSRAWSDHLLSTNRRVMSWVESLYVLAEQIDQLRLTLAERSAVQRVRVPARPEGVSVRVESTTTHQLGQMQQTLQHTLQLAETRFDQTLAALDLIRWQVVLVVQKGGSVARINPTHDISAEIAGLQDLTEAMDEVFPTIVSL